MNSRLEVLVVASLLVIFAVAFGSTLIMKGFSMTEEEAIEISRNSDTVRHYVEDGARYSLEVRYLNISQVNKARGDFPYLQEIYPESRNIWTVTWHIRPKPPSGAVLFLTHVIDDETGHIVYEGVGRYG